jgi:hypothetical protein
MPSYKQDDRTYYFDNEVARFFGYKTLYINRHPKRKPDKFKGHVFLHDGVQLRPWRSRGQSGFAKDNPLARYQPHLYSIGGILRIANYIEHPKGALICDELARQCGDTAIVQPTIKRRMEQLTFA